MQLDNSFTVATDPATAWALLTDIPRIAPCLPGAKLTGSDGAVHQGKVAVKVGPVTSRFEGTAEMTTLDADNWRAEITARGRDPRGGGNADALISAVLVPVDDGTRVDITTDLKVTGKVAQFGKGVMADVSEKLMGQFADCLAAQIAALDSPDADSGNDPAPDATGTANQSGTTTAASGASVAATPRLEAVAPKSGQPDDTDDEEVLDLVGLAGGAVAKRLVPAAIVVAIVLFVVIRWIR